MTGRQRVLVRHWKKGEAHFLQKERQNEKETETTGDSAACPDLPHMGLNLSEEVGVFCRLRVVLTAEGRGVSLQLLDWYSRRKTTTQDGPGPENKR